MAKQTLKRGSCQKCGKACFIECAKCYAVVLFEGQEHSCPEGETQTIQTCDDCDGDLEQEQEEDNKE